MEQKELTLDMVSDWVTQTGGHSQCLNFFLCWPNDQSLPQDHGRPLLSLQLTGSVTVEWVPKSPKNKCIEQASSNTGRKMSKDLFASWTQSTLSVKSKECCEGKSE